MKKGKLGLLVVSLLTLGSLAGCAGAAGEKGADGKSAYDLAVAAGFQGTVDEWLASLKGEKGADGKDGLNGQNGAPGAAGANGENGQNGENGDDGKSAYELAVANGFEGTMDEWLASLKGDKGDKGDKGSKGNPGDDGDDGLSAYELAVANGFDGTMEDWLASLNGDAGANGLSAYELYLENLEDGEEALSLEAWLASLVGEDGNVGANGKSAYELYLENLEDGEEALSLEAWLASLKGDAGAQGVSVEDVQVEHVYKAGKEYLVYTITLSNGETFTKEVLVDDGDFQSYSKYGFDGENHLIMTNDEHKAPYMITSEESFMGSVTLDGDNLDATDRYVHVQEGTGTNAIAWNEEAKVWASNNSKKANSSAEITFTAQTEGVIAIDMRCGGEANYDYTTVTLTGNAVMIKGNKEQTIGNTTYPFASKGFGDDTTYYHEFRVSAGDTITYKYAKDSSGDRNMDGCKILRVAFESNEIPPSLDSVAVVNFNSCGGTAIAPKAYKLGNELGELPAPAIDGLAFDGWFKDAEFTQPVTAATVVEEDMVLFAKYAEPIYVILSVDGQFDVRLAPKGKPFSIEDLDRTEEGLGFLGWHTDADLRSHDNLFANGTVLEGDITLYGGFEDLSGHSMERPFVVESIAEGGTVVDIETKDAKGYGAYYYVNYVAEEDEIVTFGFSDETKLSGNGYTSPRATFYRKNSGAYEEIGSTASGLRSASEDVKDLAVLTSGSDSFTKLRLSAGDDIMVKYTLYYANETSFGTAKLTMNKLDAANHEDYHNALEVQADTVVNFEKPNRHTLTWFKFTPENDGSYWVSAGDGTADNDYTYLAVGTISEAGAYTSVATNISGTGASQGGKRVDLTAGTTYYFSATANYNDLTLGFKISSSIPAGADTANPLNLTVNAEPADATYYGSYFYAKFDVAEGEEGIYEIDSTYSSASPTVYKAGTYTGTTVTLKDAFDRGDFGVAKYATFDTAGTYYVRVSNSQSAAQKLAIKKHEAGLTVEAALAFTWGDAMPVESGKYYTYKATADEKTNVAVPAGAKAEFFTISNRTKSVVATIDATDSETEVEGTVKISSYTQTYVLVTSEAESVTLEKRPYIGPLSAYVAEGGILHDKVFIGVNNGSSYYQLDFTADGYFWDRGTSLNDDIVSCELVDGILTIVTENRGTMITNGTDLALLNGSTAYFFSTRQSTYSSSALAGKGIKSSNYTQTSGVNVQQIMTDDNEYIYMAVKDGEVFFDVHPTFTNGTFVNDAGAVFEMVLGDHNYRFTTSNSAYASSRTVSYEEIEMPVIPEEPEANTVSVTVASDLETFFDAPVAIYYWGGADGAGWALCDATTHVAEIPNDATFAIVCRLADGSLLAWGENNSNIHNQSEDIALTAGAAGTIAVTSWHDGQDGKMTATFTVAAE